MHQLASKLLSMRSTGLQDTLWKFLRDILCIIFHSCPFLQMSVFQSSANLNAERSFFLWEPNFTGQVLVSRQTQRVMMREREKRRETERIRRWGLQTHGLLSLRKGHLGSECHCRELDDPYARTESGDPGPVGHDQCETCQRMSGDYILDSSWFILIQLMEQLKFLTWI